MLLIQDPYLAWGDSRPGVVFEEYSHTFPAYFQGRKQMLLPLHFRLYSIKFHTHWPVSALSDVSVLFSSQRYTKNTLSPTHTHPHSHTEEREQERLMKLCMCVCVHARGWLRVIISSGIRYQVQAVMILIPCWQTKIACSRSMISTFIRIGHVSSRSTHSLVLGIRGHWRFFITPPSSSYELS